jgi:hypothetical protein
MLTLKKIISGGQTGVDQAALNVALKLNISCGGWCPPGRLCENGKIPDNLPLVETPTERSERAPNTPRSLRTEWNVRDSDATLIIKPTKLNENKGINWTVQCIKIYGKISLVVDPFKRESIWEIHEWLRTNKIKTLNVAGPSENSFPGIGAKSFNLLLNVLQYTD